MYSYKMYACIYMGNIYLYWNTCDIYRWWVHRYCNLTRPQNIHVRVINRELAGSRMCIILLLLLLLFIADEDIYGQKHRSSNIALPRSWSHHARVVATSPHALPNPHSALTHSPTHASVIYYNIYVSRVCTMVCVCSAFAAGVDRKTHRTYSS